MDLDNKKTVYKPDLPQEVTKHDDVSYTSVSGVEESMLVFSKIIHEDDKTVVKSPLSMVVFRNFDEFQEFVKNMNIALEVEKDRLEK